MTVITAYRYQDSLPAISTDGAAGTPRINNRAELVMVDQFMQWVQDGVVFQANNAAMETGTAGQTAFTTNGVNPFFSMTVPSGTSMIPLEMSLSQEGTVAGNAWDMYFGYENADLFSSGGTAASVNNMRTDDPNTTACTNILTGATLTAPSDDRVLKSAVYTQMTADPVHSDQSVYWSARQTTAPILVGPATLFIYAWVTGTAPTLFFHLSWAEFSTTQVT